MRSYILTEKERGLLKEYLNSGETSDPFWVLLHRMNRAINTLNADITLIHGALEKYASK